jgi:hypothetical protein
METTSAVFSTDRPKSYKAILWGGLVAGTMDITAACIHSAARGGRSPIGVLQSVASGLLGAKSYEGGLATAALGLALHFFIAYTATTVFYLASRKLTFLVQQPFIFGPLYGIAVYLFMYFVVLPLVFTTVSRAFTQVLIGVLIHMFCIGLPIALVTRRFSTEPR